MPSKSVSPMCFKISVNAPLWLCHFPSVFSRLIFSFLLLSLFFSISLFLFSLLFSEILEVFKRQACYTAGFRMHSSCLVSLIVFLPAWIVTAAPNNGICYNTNGVQDGSSLPCDPKAAVSFCCQFGDMCLSNGLCEPSGNQSQYYTPYFTGLCTDYTWNSPPTCLEICNNNKYR